MIVFQILFIYNICLYIYTHFFVGNTWAPPPLLPRTGPPSGQDGLEQQEEWENMQDSQLDPPSGVFEEPSTDPESMDELAKQLRAADLAVRKELVFEDAPTVHAVEHFGGIKRKACLDQAAIDAIATPQKALKKSTSGTQDGRDGGHGSDGNAPAPSNAAPTSPDPLPEFVEAPPQPSVDNATPGASQPSAEEMKKIIHRRNSDAWHAKWVKKGVPRVPPPAAEPTAESTEPAPPIPYVSTLDARNRFVSEWIAASGMAPSNERRKAANAAWMESPLRAQLMATRIGTQN